MLALATLFWGWTFPVTKDALSGLPVFAFLAWRFGLSALCMLPLAGKPQRAAAGKGAVLGVVLFLAFALQTWGLALTSSANSAFITGFYTVWVMLLSDRSRAAMGSVLLVVAGLWFLAAPGEEGFNWGDGLTLICSFFWAWHLLLLARLPGAASSAQLAMQQFAWVAALSLAASLVFEDGIMPAAWDARLVAALAITALGATVFAFWVQTHFQRRTTALRGGLILILEPVFAACFAAAYGEELSAGTIFGGALILCAMAMALFRRPAAARYNAGQERRE